MTGDHFSDDVEFPSDLSEAKLFQNRLEAALQACRYTESDIFAIKLAVEEALVNAIKHGNQMDHDKHVRVSYAVTSARFDVRIADDGPGFNPDDVPDPTDPGNIERPCGRGLLLIRGFMTDVRYNARGNEVTMSKVRNAPPPPE